MRRWAGICGLGLALALGLGGGEVRGFSAGADGYSGKGVETCGKCHVNGKPPKSVVITGPDTLQAGATGEYTITISSATPMAQKHGGVDVATSDGALKVHAALNATKLSNGEIVQSKTAGPFDPLDFKFDLVAPGAPGMVTLFGDGLSADGVGGTSGDGNLTTKFMVTVVAAPDLAMAPPDFAGVDLFGVDLTEPPPPDLATEPVDLAVDAMSSATPMPDMAAPPKGNESRWACGCRVGGRGGGAEAVGIALVLASLASALRRRGRRRD